MSSVRDAGWQPQSVRDVPRYYPPLLLDKRTSNLGGYPIHMIDDDMNNNMGKRRALTFHLLFMVEGVENTTTTTTTTITITSLVLVCGGGGGGIPFPFYLCIPTTIIIITILW